MEQEPKMLLVPFDEVAEMKVVEEGDREGDYIIRGKGDGGRLRCYDITQLLPKDNPEYPTIKNYYMSRENGAGGGWTHKIVGTADSPYLLNPLARRMNNSTEFLVLFRMHILRTGEKVWAVCGNPFGGELKVHTGGYTDENGQWQAADPLYFEFLCNYQLYPEMPLQGEIDIHPVEEFFTK